MDQDLVKLSLIDVRVAVPAGNGVEAGLVVLEEEAPPHRQLHMYIGQAEARAIQTSWSKLVPPRPSTWDLFVSTVSMLEGRIEQVVITDVEEERHYFAQLVIATDRHDYPLYVTARPSDAIALGLRASGCELFARPEVLDAAGVLPDGTKAGASPEDAAAPAGEPALATTADTPASDAAPATDATPDGSATVVAASDSVPATPGDAADHDASPAEVAAAARAPQVPADDGAAPGTEGAPAWQQPESEGYAGELLWDDPAAPSAPEQPSAPAPDQPLTDAEESGARTYPAGKGKKKGKGKKAEAKADKAKQGKKAKKGKKR